MNNQPHVILVQPQLAENVGMAARAMMNCGLYNLSLVSPREDHLSAKALAASSGAEEILQNARLFNTTREAVAGLQVVYATTARPRNQIKTVHTAEHAAGEIDRLIKDENMNVGILFGRSAPGCTTTMSASPMRLLKFRLIPAIVRLTSHRLCCWSVMNGTKGR